MRKYGFKFDPNDSRSGLSATIATKTPWNSDKVNQMLGKKSAKYYVDIKIKNKKKKETAGFWKLFFPVDASCHDMYFAWRMLSVLSDRIHTNRYGTPC